MAPEIKVVRDDEDFELENIVLQRTVHIPEFDAVLEEMETILAQFVTWNNVINDYAVNVQNLLAPALGAMVAEVAISRNVDAVHLDLVTPFNKQRAAPQVGHLGFMVNQQTIEGCFLPCQRTHARSPGT